jgi:hypothetical protein
VSDPNEHTDHEHDVDEVREAVQGAVDATATAYAQDASTDVDERLRAELLERGVDIDDDEWVAETARGIRSGHHVQVGAPDPETPAGS